MAMPEAVECHGRNPINASDLPVPCDAEIVRLDRRAVIVTEHQRVRFWLAQAEPHPEFELLPTILLKLAHRSRRQRNNPPAVSGLWVLKPDTRLSLLKRPFEHRDRTNAGPRVP